MLFQPQITIGNHNDLLPLLAKGMQTTATLNSATLGDRSLYIGMSDMGSYLECPRAALANKLFKSSEQPLERLLQFQRGHWFEAGVAPAILSQHQTTFQQLEIEVVYEGVSVSGRPTPCRDARLRVGHIWILCLCRKSLQSCAFWR